MNTFNVLSDESSEVPEGGHYDLFIWNVSDEILEEDVLTYAEKWIIH